MVTDFRGLFPQIHPSAWVHASAQVIGEIELGAQVGIWPTAVLRGDVGAIRIGARSNIQDGAVAHATDDLSEVRVGERCTVGHRAILHGCTVGDDCLIGMGSILLDNCVIGEGTLVAAGALVPMNKVIPPGVLVMGSPAKVVRTLTQQDRDWIRHAWEIYVEKMEAWRRKEGLGT